MADDISKIGKAISQKLADFIFVKSQENIVDMGISDTGALLRSGEMVDEGEFFSVYYSAPYAQVIDEGRDPGPINPEVLFRWVRKKLGVAEKEVRSVAFLIARKIRARGTRSQPFFSNAIEQARVLFKEVIE